MLMMSLLAGSSWASDSGQTPSLASPVTATSPADAPKILKRAELPAGFAIGTGDPSLGLIVKVVDGKVEATVTKEISAANVTLKREEMEQGQMADIHNATAVTLKFDLYISPDGERFVYTSSCPVLAGKGDFEMWPGAVHSFAFGNPRVVDEHHMVCE